MEWDGCIFININGWTRLPPTPYVCHGSQFYVGVTTFCDVMYILALQVASPTGVCGGSGRCDDVIMQSRDGGKELHLYHSVKGGAPPPGDGIRHTLSTDNGRTWSESTLVLSTTLQPGHLPAESIAGKYMPAALDGKGAMVLITDGGPSFGLHAYLSKAPGDMVNFVAATQPEITAHPPSGTNVGDWSQSQIALIPDASGNVPYVTSVRQY